MKLLVLGSTGRVGSELLTLAIARHHAVTVLVRSPEKLPAATSASVVVGDPLSVDVLRTVIPGHDAVVSAFGQHGRAVLQPSTLMSRFGHVLVQAMGMTDVSRLVTVSAAVLFPPRGVPARIAGWVLRHHANDLRGMEEMIIRSPLAWTIIRPPRLIDGDSWHYVVAAGRLPEGGASISFRAVAAAMLDEVERRNHVRQVVGLAS